MITQNRRRSTVAITSLVAAAILGGGAIAGAQSPAAWPSAATGVSGNLEIHGSSTVAPISNAVAEAFVETNPDLGYVVGDEGTGAGFADFFCAGQSDISDASRKIKDEEAAACQAAGVTYAELPIAYDGLAVITSVKSPIDCLTTADLYALMGPESDNVANWKDAQALATELGSTTTFPDAPLSITAPGDESGTYDSFIELALGRFIKDRGQESKLRQPGSVYVASPNDNVIIEGVAGFDTSLGFVGLSYAEENADRVKVLGVDAGNGCVKPDFDTVSGGTYPIARTLYIYPNVGKLADNPAIVPFVDYYLSDEGLANATNVGYVALHPDTLAASRAAWLAATGR
ncbi:MAG: substrate-binding domain-containing protein [Chloroflexota bacterium]